jgi:hypothetical protein
MKRTLLAAVLGGLITLVGGAVTAQAAPITVPKSTEVGASLVQTTGGDYYYRRHWHRRHWHRPVVRWHHDHYHYAPRRYVRPHYHVRPYDWRWSDRYHHRRHYY